METEAPNFNRNYPLGGERIGPVWRDAWKLLKVNEWMNGTSLADSLAERYGVKPETVKNILRSGEVAGILVSRPMKAAGRRRASMHYRVSNRWSDEGMIP